MKSKIASLIILICLLTITPISANETDKVLVPDTYAISNFIYNGVLGLAESEDIAKNNENLSLGDGIRINTLNKYHEVVASSVIAYPLYNSENKVMGIIQQYPDSNGDIQYSYQELYAKELGRALENTEKICIVGSDTGTIIIGEKNYEYLEENELYSSKAIDEMLGAGSIATNKRYALNPTIQSAYSYPNYAILSGYPTVGQGSSNPYWCWAACESSVLSYYGVSVSVSTIASGHGLESLSFVNGRLQAYSISTSNVMTTSSLSLYLIESYTNSGYPIICGFVQSGSTSGHMVVINVYQISSINTVKFMDPWGSGSNSFKTVSSFAPLTISLTALSGTATLHEYLIAYGS